MDTSKQYIKMCEKAREVQRRWVTKEGDVYSWLETRFSVEIPRIDRWCEGCAEERGLTMPNNAIWLPRQDQLQEMVGEEYAINLLYDFHRFYNTKEDYPSQFTSMEQLWLAFVCKEKYQKIWKNEKWVKE